jgi:hypothetical protein
MTSSSPAGGGSNLLRWHLGFVLLVLLASAGVISLVWVWLGFPYRAEDAAFWPRTLAVTGIVVGLIVPAVWLLLRSQPKSPPIVHIPPAPRWWGPLGYSGVAGLAAFMAWTAQGANERRDLLWGVFWVVLIGGSAGSEALRFVREGGRRRPHGIEWLAVVMFLYVVCGYIAYEVAPVQRTTALLWVMIPMGAIGAFLWLGRRLR